MSSHNKTGKLGEIYAAKYLKENGYTVLATNHKTSFSEIDIIAMDNSCQTLCFVEVKTRKDKLHGTGSDFIFESKIHKMVLGARAYIAANNIDCDIRFDVIEVYGVLLPSGFSVSELNHIKNAFNV